MRNLIILAGIMLLLSCTNKTTTTSPAGTNFNLTGYTTEKVNGTETEYAFLKKADGSLLAEGMIENGVQNGIWITYFEEEDASSKIKTISNFVNGKLDGPYIEMNNRGQLEKRMTYLNDQIHGNYAEYKFGRPLKEFNYKKGILDGISKEYNDRGKLVKETSYKNGQLHGTIRQFDDNGTVILEYEYKNGEKISGGIVSGAAQ